MEISLFSKCAYKSNAYLLIGDSALRRGTMILFGTFISILDGNRQSEVQIKRQLMLTTGTVSIDSFGDACKRTEEGDRHSSFQKICRFIAVRKDAVPRSVVENSDKKRKSEQKQFRSFVESTGKRQQRN